MAELTTKGFKWVSTFLSVLVASLNHLSESLFSLQDTYDNSQSLIFIHSFASFLFPSVAIH
jgi:hypothetical protein